MTTTGTTTMTDRSTTPVDANSRIVLTGGAVGLGLALVGAMAWAGGSANPADVDPVGETTQDEGTQHRIIVIVPDAGSDRAGLPAMAAPARQSTTAAPVSRSQGS